MKNKNSSSTVLSSSADGVTYTSLSSSDETPPLYSDDIEEDGLEDPLERALLAEQQENQRLKDDNRQAWEQNRILINRLQNHGHATTTTPGDNELLIPEISRELMDTLVHENLRLKREMQTARFTSINTSQLEEVNTLRREKEILVERVRQLQSLQEASSDEKDALIAHMQEELKKSKAEVEGLAGECRKLVRQQEERRTSGTISDNLQKLTLENGNNGVAQVKQENAELQRENNQLRMQLQEVLQSNSKWQNYDQQREEHIKRLVTEKQELELKLAHCGGSSLSHHQVERFKELENERQQLMDTNRAMEHRIQHLERAIGTTEEERERIHVLENQVQINEEDFHRERRDREKAQAKMARLEEDNKLLRIQLEQFQTGHMAFLANRRSETMQRYREEYERQKYIQPSVGRHGRGPLVSHGGHMVVADGDSDDEDQDVIDVPMPQSSLPTQQSMLECPKCKKQFPVDDPMLFLEHNDQCNS